MRISISVLLVFFAVLSGFSSDFVKLQKADYPRQINELIFRLSCDPNDRQAAKRLLKTYSSALDDYQKEIDRLRSEPDSFKWTKTYDLMDELNELSNEIRYNSSANRLICEPRFYDEELTEVKQKAVLELCDLGTKALNSGGVQRARQSYFCFEKAVKLRPAFAEGKQKLQEAKEKATIRILIDKPAAYASYKNLYTVRFHEALLNKLQSDFLLDQFVNFYSATEFKQRKLIQNWTVRISFIDIFMENAASIDNSRSVYVNGVADIKIVSGKEARTIFDRRIPNQFIWKSFVPNNGSDLQGIFDSFSLSMTDQISRTLSDFIKMSNY